MKKNKLLSILFISLFFITCDSDEEYEMLNMDTKNPSTVAYNTLFTSATKSLVDQIVTTNYNVSIYKFLAQY